MGLFGDAWEVIDEPLEGLGLLGDTEAEEAARARGRSLSDEARTRMDAYRPGIQEMQDNSLYGARRLEDALMQRIQQKYESQGRNAVQNASARGLISSGYTASVGRDLDYRQGLEETEAYGQAAQFFQMAMDMSLRLGIGLDQALMQLILQGELGFEQVAAQEGAPLLSSIGSGAAQGAGQAGGRALFSPAAE